jgi:hypothetical protein
MAKWVGLYSAWLALSRCIVRWGHSVHQPALPQYLCCNSLCAGGLGSVCPIWRYSPVLSGVLCDLKYAPSNSSISLSLSVPVSVSLHSPPQSPYNLHPALPEEDWPFLPEMAGFLYSTVTSADRLIQMVTGGSLRLQEGAGAYTQGYRRVQDGTGGYTWGYKRL